MKKIKLDVMLIKSLRLKGNIKIVFPCNIAITNNFVAFQLDDSVKENQELNQKIVSLSLSLISVWKNLKEIYR